MGRILCTGRCRGHPFAGPPAGARGARAPPGRRRALQRAGVAVVGKVNLGLTYGADMSFRQAVPDAYRATVRDIHAFARSL
jgi:hypothetical protein